MQAATNDRHIFSAPEFLSGGGEMGQRIREFDWSSTSLGPVDTWPQSLRTCVRIMLTSRQPIWIGWGNELIKFYNDPYRAIVGGKHPWALGKPASVVWKDIWADIEPMLKQVMEKDEGTYVESQLLIMERNGYPEETYYTFSYTPIPGDDGKTAGMFCANTDDTDKIISERQLRTLTQLGKRLGDCRSNKEIIEKTIATFEENPFDFSFAIFRTIVGNKAIFAHSTPLGDSEHLIKKEIDLNANNPIADTVRTSFETLTPHVMDDVISKVGQLPKGAWQISPNKVMVLPIVQSGTKQPYGILVIGLNPYRLLDEKYKSFFELVADQVATAFADAHVLEEERKRAEALAEIDRAKTTFFSNISHEFRTPLTLLLGPIEEAIQDPNTIAENKERLDIAYRNALRMQRLVNTLLEFSRIEAGRAEGKFSRVDICTLTQDLASTFRSAIEKAGMQLIFNCGQIKHDVYVDVDMWEKIVLNLISNAFKYSNVGNIEVRVEELNNIIQLSVKDTGVGIPAAHINKIFDRFHRVENVQSRSGEGTGIGLAMVKELVRLHGGDIRVESKLGEGSNFIVTIPAGDDHLPKDTIVEAPSSSINTRTANAFLHEALKWTPGENENENVQELAQIKKDVAKPLVLVADDNADMRDYIKRLLQDDFTVINAFDGEDAYLKMLQYKPALLVSDIMMPRLDGFGLLKKIRLNADIKSIPVIFLSARAGEEAKVEGLEAGADDYLIKPFSAKELLVRVHNHIRVNEIRRETERQYRDLFLQSPAIIHIFKGPDHVFELFHPRGKDFVGGRDLSGMKLKEAAPELEGQGFFELFDDVYQNGKTYKLNETRALLANEKGELVERFFDLNYQPWYDAKGKIQGVINFGIEVTETVRARKKIEESETYFRKLADSVPAILWITEKDGSCSYLSSSWYETTGQQKEQALGFGWLSATHPEDAERTTKIFLDANEKHISFYALYRLRQKNGDYRWSIDKGTPRFDREGNFEGMIGVVIDVHEQRTTQLALEESEERQKLSVEAAGMGTWVCDLDTGMVHSSERIKEIFGFTEDVVSLEQVFNTIHLKDQQKVKEAVAASIQHPEGLYNAEYEVVNKLDGSTRSVVANGKIFFDEEWKPVRFIGTCLDISVQKKAAETILKSEERYRHIFESTPISIWEEDFSIIKNEVEKLKQDGITDLRKYFQINSEELIRLIQSLVIIDINEATVQLLEGSSKEELKEGLHKIFVEDTSDAFIRELEVIASGGGHFEYESTLQTLKGKKIDVLIHIDFPKDDNYSSVLVTLVDISQRREAERILKESEEQFRSLTETLPQLIWMMDTEGHPLYISSRWEEFTGKHSDPQTWEDIVHPEDFEHVMKTWEQSLKTGEHYRTELRLKSKSGEYYWFFMQGEPIRNEEGQILKWIGSATDIHDQKEIERRLEELVSERTQELQRSNQDLQQFAHVASHDLKEPLRKIKTFTSRMSIDSETSFSEKSKTYLDKINSAADRMNTMIEGVLNYSMFNAKEQVIQPVNLNNIIQQIESDLEVLIAQKSATLQYKDLPTVEGASVLLYQLFYNLINNSLKFSKNGIASIIQTDASILEENRKSLAQLRITDNGIGFQQEYANEIFKTFSRLNSRDQFEGTGLGLSLCKRIVERHGGSIEAFGEVGKGASFVIQLPLKQEKNSL